MGWGGGGGGGGGVGLAVKPSLEVLPPSVWSPTSRGVAPPPTMQDEVIGDRDYFEAAGSEDSLLSHAELAAGAVSSILRDSDLKKVEAPFVEEALALLLQGTASVRPSAFVDLFLYCFSSVSLLFVFWQVATYVKGLVRMASLTEGSTRATKSNKAKVASLTSERVGIRA